MTTIPASLTAEEQDHIDEKVAIALNGYIASRSSMPDGAELAAFDSRVRQSITQAFLKGRVTRMKEIEDAEIYEQRKATVMTEASHYGGIKFMHFRDMELVEDQSTVVNLPDGRIAVTKIFSNETSSTGGYTVAYKYELGFNNTLYMNYVVAFCQPNERFDKVIGMEQALEKFLRGDILSMTTSHDALGWPKKMDMVSKYRAIGRN